MQGEAIKVYHNIRWYSGMSDLESLPPWSNLQPLCPSYQSRDTDTKMELFLCLVAKIYPILLSHCSPQPLKSNFKVLQLRCPLSFPRTLKSCSNNSYKICCCSAATASCRGSGGTPEVSVSASCHPGNVRGVVSEQWLMERREVRGQRMTEKADI